MLEPDVLEMFRQSSLNAQGGLLLPEMSRDLYDRCKKVLDKMGFRWDGRKSVRAHVMQGDLDAAQALAHLVETGEAPKGNQFAFWPSSPRLVEMVLEVADSLGAAFNFVLEPSAGEGAIIEAVQQRTGHQAIFTAVEIHPGRATKLRALGNTVDVAEGDFLQASPSILMFFDTVLMNPPFAVQGNALAYVDHIEHAWRFVKRNGVLVSVVPAGLTFRTDSKVARLRNFIEELRLSGNATISEFGSDPKMKTGVYMLVVGMRKA
jgi:predicted RNA methylase